MSTRRGLKKGEDDVNGDGDNEIKISHVIHQLSERDLMKHSSKGKEGESVMTFGFGGSKKVHTIPKRAGRSKNFFL